MKRIISILLVLSMLLGSSAAMAEMGVQVIGGPVTVTEPVSLDDFKLGAEAEIEGYGILYATEFAYKDRLGYYRSGRKDVYATDDFYLSGNEADYALLRIDVTNTSPKSHDFLSACEVKWCMMTFMNMPDGAISTIIITGPLPAAIPARTARSRTRTG